MKAELIISLFIVKDTECWFDAQSTEPPVVGIWRDKWGHKAKPASVSQRGALEHKDGGAGVKYSLASA